MILFMIMAVFGLFRRIFFYHYNIQKWSDVIVKLIKFDDLYYEYLRKQQKGFKTGKLQNQKQASEKRKNTFKG